MYLGASSPVFEPEAEPPPITTRTLNAGGGLSINIQSNGNYEVIQNKTKWLNNDATFFQSRGKTYSTSQTGHLQLTHFGTVESGWDNLGEYSSLSLTYQLQDCDVQSSEPDDEPIAEPPPCTKSVVLTSFRAYKLSPLIVFSQVCNNLAAMGMMTTTI